MEQDRKPRINPCTYGQLLYDKGGKTMQCWKQSHQQIMLGKLDSYMLKIEIRPFFNSIHKNKLKMD